MNVPHTRSRITVVSFRAALASMVFLVVGSLFIDLNGRYPYLGERVSAVITILLFTVGFVSSIGLFIADRARRVAASLIFVVLAVMAVPMPLGGMMRQVTGPTTREKAQVLLLRKGASKIVGFLEEHLREKGQLPANLSSLAEAYPQLLEGNNPQFNLAAFDYHPSGLDLEDSTRWHITVQAPRSKELIGARLFGGEAVRLSSRPEAWQTAEINRAMRRGDLGEVCLFLDRYQKEKGGLPGSLEALADTYPSVRRISQKRNLKVIQYYPNPAAVMQDWHLVTDDPTESKKKYVGRIPLEVRDLIPSSTSKPD